MSVKYAYRYRVLGPGRFPVDMLRYDRAHPASESDSANIERRGLPGLLTAVEAALPVDLIALDPPTPRWLSFGWIVVATAGRPLVERIPL